jgi:ubiquinone/menaquinone biosynthesis C-methylase UbiE
MNKIIKTVEEVREYIQQDYWQSGQTKNCSGYEKFYIDWDWNNRLVEALEQAYDFKGKTVIDLGCAYGQVVSSLLKKGYQAYGVDLSDFAIQAGHKEFPPLVSKTKQGSIHDLSSYESNMFDFLYSNQVFEHVPGDVCDQLAKETFRIAKSGAILWAGLVLDLSSEYQPHGFNPKDTDKTHINLRPKPWWDDKMTKAGWIINDHFDNTFRNHRLPDGYSFFDEYGWHSICYRKT